MGQREIPPATQRGSEAMSVTITLLRVWQRCRTSLT